VSGAYIYEVGKVTDGGANVALVGKYIPQVPQNRGSFDITYSNAKFARVSFGVQFVGHQFDDDVNTRGIPSEGCKPLGTVSLNCIGIGTPGLPGYNSVDLSVSRTLFSNFDAFFGIQNVADTVYYVQTNPSTVGTPRLVTAGLRVKWAGR